MKVTVNDPISDAPASHERKMIRTYEVEIEVADDEGASLGETVGETVIVNVTYSHYDDTKDNYYRISDIEVEGYPTYTKVQEAILLAVIEALREEGFSQFP